MESFALEQFSTNLIMECILQHLESNIPSRPYIGNNNTIQEFSQQDSDDIKKWFKLCDILIQCIRHDLRKYRATDANNKIHLFQDRTGAATVIFNWYPDLFILCNIYHERFESVNEMLHKEYLGFQRYVTTLKQLCTPIYDRQQHADMQDTDGKKDEVVFIYDDNTDI
jgi:hypothetical protein